MKRRTEDPNPLRGARCMGLKLPRFFGELMEKFVDWYFEIEPPIRNAEDYQNRQERSARRFLKKEARNRASSTRGAVKAASQLLVMFKRAQDSGDPKAWESACKLACISKRTALNRLALLHFSFTQPKLFKLFASLGRTKLYHLARQPKEVLKQLDPRKLKGMTDRELLAHLREVCPVPKRKRISGLRQSLLRCLQTAADEARLMRLGREELKQTAEESQELFKKVHRAYEKSA